MGSLSCSSHLFPFRRFFVLFGIAAMGLTATGKAQGKLEIFGGYSYLRASIEVGQTGPLGPGVPCPPNCGTPPVVTQNANLNGWEFSGQYKFLQAHGELRIRPASARLDRGLVFGRSSKKPAFVRLKGREQRRDHRGRCGLARYHDPQGASAAENHVELKRTDGDFLLHGDLYAHNV